MARHANRDSTSGQFVPVPQAATTVDDLSGQLQAEHDEPGDMTHYGTSAHKVTTRWLPHRSAVLVDASTGETLGEVPEHVMRAIDMHVGSPARRAAHLAAVPAGDDYAEFLMGGTPDGPPVDDPQRDAWNPRTVRPTSRGQGRAR